MNSRLQLFWQIRQESRVDGVPAALQTARTAVADGRMALTDVPEVFLALRHGDWQRLLPAEVAKVAANDGGARVAA